MAEKYGIKPTSNKGRELSMKFKGKTYNRYPVETPKVKIGDDIYEFIEKYAKPHYKTGDIFCISAKVVSIARSLVVHQSEVKISPLAKLIVKFVTKWPDDIGYSHPRKMQVAINMAGYPRTLTALGLGTGLKLIGKPGYFYRIMGNNVNAIDGFNPISIPPMNEYAVLPPHDGDDWCNEIEQKYGMKTVILDGNNVDNNILGMSVGVKELFTKEEFMQVVKGNPQGQEDDDGVTPVLMVRQVNS